MDKGVQRQKCNLSQDPLLREGGINKGVGARPETVWRVISRVLRPSRGAESRTQSRGLEVAWTSRGTVVSSRPYEANLLECTPVVPDAMNSWGGGEGKCGANTNASLLYKSKDLPSSSVRGGSSPLSLRVSHNGRSRRRKGRGERGSDPGGPAYCGLGRLAWRLVLFGDEVGRTNRVGTTASRGRVWGGFRE